MKVRSGKAATRSSAKAVPLCSAARIVEGSHLDDWGDCFAGSLANDVKSKSNPSMDLELSFELCESEIPIEPKKSRSNPLSTAFAVEVSSERRVFRGPNGLRPVLAEIFIQGTALSETDDDEVEEDRLELDRLEVDRLLPVKATGATEGAGEDWGSDTICKERKIEWEIIYHRTQRQYSMSNKAYRSKWDGVGLRFQQRRS
tara:strand:+ start:283 stop:885 length:603 start_codon:yes stop_codon:yes gene_type:complete